MMEGSQVPHTSMEWRFDWSLAMPACKNCEGFVTDQYVRVFAPAGMDDVRVCPNCEDKLREGAEIREAHAPRQSNNV
jgi:NAD-dependent SIR2 family protein deacetylase